MLHSILNTFTCCSRYFFRELSFPFNLKKTSSHGHESTIQTAQVLATAEKSFPKVCSHCVSRRTLHLHAMVPLLHPSKATLDACMLHQEELTGGFNAQGDWTQSTGVPTCWPITHVHLCTTLQKTKTQDTTVGPWGWLGNFCVSGDVSRVLVHHW